MKEKFKRYYMKTAIETSNLSYCERSQVGAILVKDGSIISMGYNGTISGFPNICENDNNETHPWVIHAEENCITKVAKSTFSTKDSSMFITLQPCMNCAKLIISSGITDVYFYNEYRISDGVDLLRRANVNVEQVYF